MEINNIYLKFNIQEKKNKEYIEDIFRELQLSFQELKSFEENILIYKVCSISINELEVLNKIKELFEYTDKYFPRFCNREENKIEN